MLHWCYKLYTQQYKWSTFHWKGKLSTLYLVLICQLDIYVVEISSRDTVNAFAQIPSHYLSLPDYWSLLNTEQHLYIERQGIQLCNKIVVFLTKEVTLDFQGFHWNRVALSLQNERETYNRIWRVVSQALSNYGKDMGLFLGLTVDCYTCQLSLTMHRNMMIHFYCPPSFHCKQGIGIPSVCSTVHKLPLVSGTSITDYGFCTAQND